MKLYRGLAHGLNQMGRHRNVVHGDIKPANLILTREPNRLVLIDFGSAWTVERTVEHWQSKEGDGYSEHYAAPEQLCESPRADFRSDQFSATAVAYRMLTGEVPYAGRGGLAGKPQNRQTYEPRYRPPSQICPLRDHVPKRIWQLIDEVIAQGLKLDPNRRFQSGTLWIEALEDLHCEMRSKRRVHFNLRDNLLIRVFEWFCRRDTPPR